MEITEQELQQKLEAAKAEGAVTAEKKLVEGTTWTSAQALRESAVNAERKIGEHGQKIGELKTQLESAKTELETVRKAGTSGAGGNGDGKGGNGDGKTANESDPKILLATMSDKESEALDALIEADKDLKKQVTEAKGDELPKKMAELLQGYRKLQPTNLNVVDKPFSSFRKAISTGGAKSTEELLKKAMDSYQSRKRIPAGSRASYATSNGQGNEDTAPVRSSGGAMEFRRVEEEG
jgi:hypothetical protein